MVGSGARSLEDALQAVRIQGDHAGPRGLDHPFKEGRNVLDIPEIGLQAGVFQNQGPESVEPAGFAVSCDHQAFQPVFGERGAAEQRGSMAFPDRSRLPLSFDPILLRRDLDTLSSTGWTSHFVRQNYEGDWSVIPLRSAAGETHPIRMIYSDPTATVFEDTPMLGPCGYFRQVLAAFACEVRSVRLMRLTPGSIIKEHTDLDLDVEAGAVRIHIPITTNPEVDFRLNGSRVVMEPGSVWYLRLADPHSVANRGREDRVHLVLDLVANDWVRGLLLGAAAAV
jgi:hypothetical protein